MGTVSSIANTIASPINNSISNTFIPPPQRYNPVKPRFPDMIKPRPTKIKQPDSDSEDDEPVIINTQHESEYEPLSTYNEPSTFEPEVVNEPAVDEPFFRSDNPLVYVVGGVVIVGGGTMVYFASK
jgi:hypothetical protein